MVDAKLLCQAETEVKDWGQEQGQGQGARKPIFLPAPLLLLLLTFRRLAGSRLDNA